MRSCGVIFVLASLLLANAAIAQATQPNEIRRDASQSVAANSTAPSATRVALSLVAVLALVVVLFLVAKRFLPRGAFAQQAGGAVQVLARTAISPKQRVILLQVGRRILVVADGGQALTTLSEIKDSDEAAALIAQLQTERSSGSFTAALNSAMEKFRSAQSSAAEPQPDIDSMREEIEGMAQRVRGMAR